VSKFKQLSFHHALQIFYCQGYKYLIICMFSYSLSIGQIHKFILVHRRAHAVKLVIYERTTYEVEKSIHWLNRESNTSRILMMELKVKKNTHKLNCSWKKFKCLCDCICLAIRATLESSKFKLFLLFVNISYGGKFYGFPFYWIVQSPN